MIEYLTSFDFLIVMIKIIVVFGGVMGSFAVEDFGTRRLQSLTREEIDERFKLFRELTHLD